MHVPSSLLASSLALCLALVPARAFAGPPPPPPSDDAAEAPVVAEPTPSADGAQAGGVYGEPVDYGWNEDIEGPEPETGPRVDIEVHNSLRPVYLTRPDGTELCEAPCGRRIGDPGGQFVLSGPGRKASKPFSLSGGDSLRLQVKGGDKSKGVLGVVVIGVSAALAIGLAITPTRVNMPRAAGFATWGGAAVIGVAGIASGVVLLRFSRTQVRVLE